MLTLVGFCLAGHHNNNHHCDHHHCDHHHNHWIPGTRIRWRCLPKSQGLDIADFCGCSPSPELLDKPRRHLSRHCVRRSLSWFFFRWVSPLVLCIVVIFHRYWPVCFFCSFWLFWLQIYITCSRFQKCLNCSFTPECGKNNNEPATWEWFIPYIPLIYGDDWGLV